LLQKLKQDYMKVHQQTHILFVSKKLQRILSF